MATSGHPRTRDAVVVVPGLMGSELIKDGELLWGMRPKTLFNELMTGSILRKLEVTEDRLAGLDDGVRPGGLITFPVILPGLSTIEPYSSLVSRLSGVVADPSALTVLPYDWRVSIKESAERLAGRVERHLDSWRSHPKGSIDAQVSFVCHSMGGLIARYFAEVLGGRSVINQLTTFGTPYAGSVKAIRLLADGQTLKYGLLRARLRRFSRTLPGIYELLPTYECVDTEADLRALEPSDLKSIGATRELLAAARSTTEEMRGVLNQTGYVPFEGLRTIVGTAQPTLSSVRFSSGEALFSDSLGDVNYLGDGTVYRGSAYTATSVPAYLPQCHGALARSPEGIANATALLTEQTLGPPMGIQVGLDLPDDAVAGMWLLTRKSDSRAAGILLGLAATLKLYPILLAIPLYVLGRRRASLYSLATLIGTNLVGAVIFGITPAGALNALQETSRAWLAFGANASISIWLTRIGLPVGAAGAAAWLLALVAVIAVAWRRPPFDLAVATTIIIALLGSPLSWEHYDLVLVPVAALLWSAGSSRWLTAGWAATFVFGRFIRFGDVPTRVDLVGYVAIAGRLALLVAALSLVAARAAHGANRRVGAA